VQDGLFYNGLVCVTFELRDTRVNGGGFCCVPGSHQVAKMGLRAASAAAAPRWTVPFLETN
jgi:hypothetical protein